MTLAIIIVAAIAAAAAIAAVWYVSNRNHSRDLRELFGPEYDHELSRLDERQTRVSRLNIDPRRR